MWDECIEWSSLTLREWTIGDAVARGGATPASAVTNEQCARTRQRQDDAVTVWHSGIRHLKLNAEQCRELRRLCRADEAHCTRERPFVNQCKAAQSELYGARNERLWRGGGAQEAERRLRMQLGKRNLINAISHRRVQGTNHQRVGRGRSARASRVR
jgi:hypothetical protein